jgi:hypothetical protein
MIGCIFYNKDLKREDRKIINDKYIVFIQGNEDYIECMLRGRRFHSIYIDSHFAQPQYQKWIWRYVYPAFASDGKERHPIFI